MLAYQQIPDHSHLLLAILDLFQRAKTSVHSNQEQHSFTTITVHIEQKKGKQYKITYLQSESEKQMTYTNSCYLNTCIYTTAN